MVQYELVLKGQIGKTITLLFNFELLLLKQGGIHFLRRTISQCRKVAIAVDFSVSGMAEKLRRGESLTGVNHAFMQFFKKKPPAGGLQLWEPRFSVCSVWAYIVQKL